MTVSNTMVALACKFLPSAVGRLPYPGESARFEYERTVGSEGDTSTLFKSYTQNSLITDFTFSKSLAGRVAFVVSFRPEGYNAKKVENYLEQFDLPFYPPAPQLRSITPGGLVTIFNILANNNYIPEPHFSEMRYAVLNSSMRSRL